MRVFAIRNADDPLQRDAALLFYCEREKKFRIELPDDASPWNTPLILSSVLIHGSKTVNAYWSKVWVRQRIVPPERQNIDHILKENEICSYDEFALLLKSEGRCVQDSFYISEITL